MAIGLTARGNELLVFIAGYQHARHGVSPSYREMADALGLRGKHTVHYLITRLVERGRIRRIKYRARAIEILEGPSIPLIDMRDRTHFEHKVWDDGEKALVPLARERNPG